MTDRAVTSAHVSDVRKSGVKCKRRLESQNFNNSLTFCLEKKEERERERERERKDERRKKKKERKREQARKEKR